MNIDQLRTICLNLPGATEDIKWGNDLCFSVAGKMFCVCATEPLLTVSVKVQEKEFYELTELAEVVPAPYVARYYWIQVIDPNAFTSAEWEHYISRSYEAVKSKIPKKKLREFNLL